MWGRWGQRMFQWPLQWDITGGGLTSRGSCSCQLPPWRRRRRKRKKAASAAVTERFRDHLIAPGRHAEACGRKGHVRSENHHPLDRTVGQHLDALPGLTALPRAPRGMHPGAAMGIKRHPRTILFGQAGAGHPIPARKKDWPGTKSTPPALPTRPAALQRSAQQPRNWRQKQRR